MGERLRRDAIGSLVMIRLPLFFVVITEDAEHPSGEAVILACFSSGKISEKSIEISPRFCYYIDISLCSSAGVKNPRWQADT